MSAIFSKQFDTKLRVGALVAILTLGGAGAVVGYLIFTRGLGIGDDDAFDLGGLLSAIIGVLIVLGIAGLFARRGGAGTGTRRTV